MICCFSKKLLLLLGTLLFLASPSFAQDENALVYLNNYQVLETRHFKVHYPLPSLAQQAQWSAQILEQAYQEFTNKMKFPESKQKIALFLYSSAGALQRSNISDTFGKQSRLGFSEPLKDRIVMWLSPSQRENRYQLRLNLAQILIFQVLFPDKGAKLLFRFVYSEWMITGLAIYLAGEYDPFAELALQDAVFTNRVRPLVELKATRHLNPHELTVSYRYMREVFRYLEKQYGIEKLRLLLQKLPLSFADSLLEEVYGLNEDTLHQEVLQYLKQKWQSSYQQRQWLKTSQPVTEYQSYYSHWDFGPTVSPTGKEVAFLSDRHNEVYLYGVSPQGGQWHDILGLAKKVLINNIQGLTSPPVYSPDGSKILVQGRDDYKTRLFLIARGSGSDNKVLDYLEFDDYAGFCFSSEGSQIYFIGVKGGEAQLYSYSFLTHKLRQLTTSATGKLLPAISPQGDKLAYVAEFNEQRDIVVMDLDTLAQTRVVLDKSDELSPHFIEEDQLVFTSTQAGSLNLYRLDWQQQQITQLSNVPGAIVTPSLSPEKTTVFFSYYHQGVMRLHQVKLSELAAIRQFPLVTQPITEQALSHGQAEGTVSDYVPETSSDYLFPFVVVNALRASDLSETHKFSTQVGVFSAAIIDSGGGDGGDSAVDVNLGIQGSFSYTYADFLSFSLFSNLQYVEEDEDLNPEEENTLDYALGGIISAAFELSPFLTMELGYSLIYQRRSDNLRAGFDRYFVTGGVFVELDLDLTQRRGLDPTGGYQVNLRLSGFSQALGSELNYQLIEFDARYYWSLCEDHVIMLRLQADIGHDDIPFDFDLAGDDNLRGVANDDFEGIERWVATIEYRFPIYRDLNFFLLGLLKDIRGFVFFDLGSATNNVITELDNGDDMDIVYAVGAGLRLDYYFLEHFPVPLLLQGAKRLDEDESAIFYIGVTRDF